MDNNERRNIRSRQPIAEDLTNSLSRGVLNARAGIRGGIGATAGAFGAEQFALEQAVAAAEDARRASTLPQSVGTTDDIRAGFEKGIIPGISDVARFAANKTAETVPNIVPVAGAALAARFGAKKAIPGLTTRGKDVATAAGALTGTATLETGELFQDLLADEQARKDLSVQDLSRTALAGGTLSGALDLVGPGAVLKKLGLLGAADNQIKKSLLRRAGEAALTGGLVEGATEPLQELTKKATHKFVNDNIELFDDESIREYIEAAAAGGAAGFTLGGFGGLGSGLVDKASQTKQSRFDEIMEDMQAQEELGALRSEQFLRDIEQADPELAAQYRAEDLFNLDVQDSIKASHTDFFGENTRPKQSGTARVIGAYLNENSELRQNPEYFNETVVPFIQNMLGGNLRGEQKDLQPEIEQLLRSEFTDYETMLESVNDFTSAIREEEQVDAEVGEKNAMQQAMSDALYDEANTKTEDEVLAEDGAFGAYDIADLGDSDTRSIIRVEEDPETGESVNSPVRSKDTNEAVHGRAFDSHSTDKQIQRLSADNPDSLFTAVGYGDLFTEQARESKVTSEDITAALEAEAARLAAKNPDLARLFKGDSPKQFLNRFEGIREEKLPAQLGSGERFGLSAEKVDSLVRGRSHTQKELPRGDFQVSVPGKNGKRSVKNVNTMDLIKTVMPNVNMEDGNFNADRVAKLFSTALAALLDTGRSGGQPKEGAKYNDIQLAGELPDSLVVFSQKVSGETREFTLGEIRRKGSGQIKVQIQNERAKLAKVAKNSPQAEAIQERINTLTELMVTTRRNEGTQDQSLLARSRSVIKKQDTYEKAKAAQEHLDKTEEKLAKRKERDLYKEHRADEKQGKILTTGAISGEELLHRREAHGPKQPQSKTLGMDTTSKHARSVARDSKDFTDEGYDPDGQFTAKPELEGKIRDLQKRRLALKPLGEDLAKTKSLREALALVKEYGLPVPTRTALKRWAKEQNITPLEALDGYVEQAYQETFREGKKANREQTVQRTKEETSNIDKAQAGVKASEGGKYTLRNTAKLAQQEHTTENRREAKLLKQWAEKLGIARKITFMTPQRAASILENDPVALAKFKAGKLGGFMKYEKGQYLIFVHPELTGRARMETIAHEMGHVVFRESATRLTVEEAQNIWNEFQSWRSSLRGDMTVHEALRGRTPYQMLQKMLEDSSIDTLQLDETSTEYLEYLRDFEEWFSDHTARWLTVDKKPVGAIEKFFKQVAEFLKKAYVAMGGMGFTPNNSVAEYLNSLWKHKPRTEVEGSVWDRIQKHEAKTKYSKDIPNKLLDRVREQISKITGLETVPATPKKGSKTEAKYDAAKKVLYVSKLFKDESMGAVFNEMLRYSWGNLLNAEERRVLGRAFEAQHVQAQIKKLLKDHPKAWKQAQHSTEAMAAFGFQFWMAGKLNVGPQTNTAFQKAASAMREAFGFIHEQDQATQILEALRDGQIAAREQGTGEFAVQAVVNDGARIKAVAQSVDKALDKGLKIARPVFSAANWRMRATKIPALTRLADMIEPEAGSEGKARGMMEARTMWIGRFTTDAMRIFEDKDEAFGERVHAALLDPENNKFKKNSDEQRAVDSVHKLMNDMYKYAKAAGIDMGQRENYFPWVMNMDYLQRNSDKLMDLVMQEKFQEPLQKLADTKNKRLEEWYKEQGKTMPADKRIDWKEAGRQLVHEISNNNGYADVEINTDLIGHNPAFRSANKRMLNFIQELGDAKDMQVLDQFFDKDFGRILSTYITQVVKRAEYSRRFGDVRNREGDIVGDKLQQLIADARDQGATDNDINLVRDYLNGVMGTAGSTLDPRLKAAYEFFTQSTIEDPQEAARKLQKFQSVLMVYQNFRLLGMAAFTSLADPMGILVRGGDFDTAFTAFKAGMSEVYHKSKGNQSELRQIAEELGIINMKLASEALGYEFGGVYFTGKTQKLNEWLFKYNGMQSLTRGTRLMALAGGMSFLKKHADGKFNKHSERYLNQLNLGPGDVVIRNGQVYLHSHAERLELADKAHKGDVKALAELARDERIRSALNRFVDEAILRPNAAHRPIWASDPHFMSVFHLKQFMYSMHDRILKRVWSEMAEHGNYAPLMLLTMWVPAMIASDWLRDLVQNGGDVPRKANWTTGDYVWNGVQRSGVTGTWQMLIDAGNDVKFGSAPGDLGPTADQLGQLPKLFSSDDNTQWQAFLKSLPLNNIFRQWDWVGG